MNETRQFTDRNEGFICVHCGMAVLPSSSSCRNHCPHCLHSVHLDRHPGDRGSDCQGLMIPIAVEYHSKKGYQIVHRCERCGVIRKNVAALNDPLQPDELDTLLRIMTGAGG